MLISSLPLLQRRFNLHLESRTTEHGRLLQLEEVLADAERYPAGTPVIVAGDLNTMHRHSPLIARMHQAGYTSCFGDRRMRTHILIGALDWVLVKGPIKCEGAEVHRDFHASDHFPISAELRF